MARVNLVPEGRRERRRGRRLAISKIHAPRGELIVGALALLLLLLAAMVHMRERRGLAEARAAVVEAQADSARLHSAAEGVRRIELASEKLAARVEVLEAVLDGRAYWLRLMESLSRALPAYTWLERVDRQEVGSQEIRVLGVSFANAAITDFMRQLEESAELQNVRLLGVNRGVRDSLDVQQFTVIAALEGHSPVPLEREARADPDREVEPTGGRRAGGGR